MDAEIHLKEQDDDEKESAYEKETWEFQGKKKSEF